MIGFEDISLMRLANQQVLQSEFKSAKGLLEWMGAMQAQDYNMAKWAAGIRLPGSSEQMIEAALEKADVVRTHLMRPTWHLVSSENIYWMLALTAPQIITGLKSRHRDLELDESIFKKTHEVLRKVLAAGNHLTRDELTVAIEKAKIPVDSSRMNHILLRGELDGIICNGIKKGKKISYALLQERVKPKKILSIDEALIKLATLYFTSHGPATLQDFVWWSGLNVSQARKGMEAIKPTFISEKINEQVYLFSSNTKTIKQDSIFLLPAYDEFLISYRDRKASLPFEHLTKTVSDNGIFRPIVVVNGQVVGLWTRAAKINKMKIEIMFLSQKLTGKNKVKKDLLEEAAQRFGTFLKQPVELKIV